MAVQREIDLLREYRNRLIADVVTGKLDVREATAKLPEVDSLAADDWDGTIHCGEDSSLRSCQKVCKRDQAALLIPSLVVASSWIGFPSWYLRPA